MSEALPSWVPLEDGFLPPWLLFISVVSIGNSVQCYVSTAGSRQVYNGSSDTTQITSSGDKKTSTTNPVNQLSARTFGTWTALSSIVRMYAAWHISDPLIYQICLWTYAIAFAHFASEWLIFKTAKFGRGLIGPLVVSTLTATWMLAQWSCLGAG